jgi:hypothetical protein
MAVVCAMVCSRERVVDSGVVIRGLRPCWKALYTYIYRVPAGQRKNTARINLDSKEQKHFEVVETNYS